MTFVLGAKRRALRRRRKPCQGQVVYVKKQGEGTAEAVLFSWLPLARSRLVGGISA